MKLTLKSLKKAFSASFDWIDIAKLDHQLTEKVNNLNLDSLPKEYDEILEQKIEKFNEIYKDVDLSTLSPDELKETISDIQQHFKITIQKIPLTQNNFSPLHTIYPVFMQFTKEVDITEMLVYEFSYVFGFAPHPDMLATIHAADFMLKIKKNEKNHFVLGKKMGNPLYFTKNSEENDQNE